MGPLEQQARDEFLARRQRMWAAAEHVRPKPPRYREYTGGLRMRPQPALPPVKFWSWARIQSPEEFICSPAAIIVSKDTPKQMTIAIVVRAASKHFRTTKNELISHRRQPSIVYPRHVAQFVAKEMTSRSYPEIALYFGGRDHTSILHAVQKMNKKVADPRIAMDVATVMAIAMEMLNAPAGDEG